MGYTSRAKLQEAFHEAGHACMALALGRPATGVSLVFRHTPARAAKAGRPPAGYRGPCHVEADIMVGLAGPLAERHARASGTPHAEPPPPDDLRIHDEVAALVSGLALDADERAAWLDRLCQRTEKALMHRGCWEGVTAVAWALVYRLHLPPAEVELLFWRAALANQVAEQEQRSVDSHAQHEQVSREP